MTLADYCARWLVTRTARLAPNAHHAYQSALTHHVLPAFGPQPLATLTTTAIRHWLEGELAKRRPVNSVRASLVALSTLLTDAVIDGLLTANVAHGAGRRLLPQRVARPHALLPAELAALLSAARLIDRDWAPACFTLASRTGLRLGELLGLHASDVLVDHWLRVERSYFGARRFGPPKNGLARLVEVSPRTSALLARLVDLAPRCGYLFASPRRPAQPLAPCSVDHAFAQAVAVAGLPMHLSPHCLRHTYASLLLDHGADAQWVQQQLGHASYRVTVDTYGSGFRHRRPDLLALLDQEEAAHHPPMRFERPRAKVLAMRRRRG